MRSPFPSGRLVAASLLISAALGAVMLFGTLGRISVLAEGLEPFDLRPRGYSIGEARALIALLGEEGRRYYATVHQWAANLYPLTFLVSRGLLFWWLTADGRIAERPIPKIWRYALLLLPAAEVVPDYLENVRIMEMLAAGSEVGGDVVAAASLATQAKILLTGLTEFAVLLLGIIAIARSLRRRAGPGR
jgi:hypothetical protein